MTKHHLLHTRRLEMLAATLEDIQAEISDRASLGPKLGAAVPDSWPPGEYDDDALRFFEEQLVASPKSSRWLSWYVMSVEDSCDRVLVGAAGYLGPPDDDGIVEIGYSLIPESRGKGYATEAVNALAANALADPDVQRIIAHIEAANHASAAVLRRCGFEAVGPGESPSSLRFERRRPSAGPSG